MNQVSKVSVYFSSLIYVLTEIIFINYFLILKKCVRYICRNFTRVLFLFPESVVKHTCYNRISVRGMG